MDMQVLFLRQGNDETVEARYGPEVSDPTGVNAELYLKDDRYTPDEDPSTRVYTSDVFPDPANTAQLMSSFLVPDTDTAIAGAFWYRVDLIDSLESRKTAGCGTLLVEAV
jgi:hypothetical protein